MNVIKKLIVNRHCVGETIKLMTKSRKCTNTNWTQLDDYISSLCQLVTTNEFDTIFPDKSILRDYPNRIVLSEKNKLLSGKWKSQPFGTQNPPDFIGFEAYQNYLYIFYIECKSGKGEKATWNCSLPIPKPYVLYPYFNKTINKLSLCSGVNLINPEEYQLLQSVMPLLREKNNIEHITKNWSLYLRPMWCTLENHPDNTSEIENYITAFS